MGTPGPRLIPWQLTVSASGMSGEPGAWVVPLTPLVGSRASRGLRGSPWGEVGHQGEESQSEEARVCKCDCGSV